MGVTAQDAIKQMQSWIGTDKRAIIDLYNNHKPLAHGYKVKYTDAWCDTTISSLFIMLDSVDLIGGTECGVERHISLFQKVGIWEEDGSVTPEPGWIVCYNWDDSTQPNDGFADHIGLVESVNGTTISVIEGNYNDAVRRRIIPVGLGYIRGYAKPKYGDSKKEGTETKGVDNMIKTVIDVSYAQPNVDWERVKPQIDGAILRCGYGSNIDSQDDKQWFRNVSECERLGIPYGVYLYSYADTGAKIQSEIDHTLRLIKGHNPVIGVFLDLEENSLGWIAPRAAEMWCQQIAAAGYKPGIYTGAYYYRSHMSGTHERTKALWWIAGYGKNSGIPELDYKPDTGFRYDAWQYTSRKRVDGISGLVDCSEWYTDWRDEETTANAHIRYRAHVQKKGWMPSVADGEIAGTVGEALRLEAIKITPPEGVELEVIAHVQTYGNKKYTGIVNGKSSGIGSSDNDPIIGTVGQKKRLEALTIRCAKNTTGKRLKYQAHCQGIGWQDPVNEGEMCGTIGQSRRMEAIKIWLE